MDRLLIWDIEVARLREVLVQIGERRPTLNGWINTNPNTAANLTPEVWARFIERVRRGEL